jgi:Protein of unknown function (DUF2555)
LGGFITNTNRFLKEECSRLGGASIMKTLTISKNQIATMTAEDVDTLATRLEQDNYGNAFEGLNDWHLLRAVAFQRPELVESYVHLLDLEAYDEA